MPVVTAYLSRMDLSPERASKSYSRIVKEFDAVAERLEQQGSDYILDGRFTAADLSFAAMASPMLFPQPHEGFAGYLPPVEVLPDALQQQVRQLRAHPAGQHAMRMFRWHRGKRALPGGGPPLPTEPPHDVESSGEGGGGGLLGPAVVARGAAEVSGPGASLLQ